MSVELKCAEPGHSDKCWMLDVDGEAAVLSTPAGEQVARFSQDDARRRFGLPSLAEDQPHFSIAFEEQTVRFVIRPSQLPRIERFLERGIVQRTPRGAAYSNVTTGAPETRASSAPFRHMPGASERTPRLKVTTPVKMLGGVLGIVFLLANVAALFNQFGGETWSPVLACAQVAGAAFGLLIAMLCFRRRANEADDIQR